MSEMRRISLIHATPLAIQPIQEAFAELWPEVEVVSLLEEALSVDRGKSEELTESMLHRIALLTQYAQGLGAQGVLFTCSAFGLAIEQAAKASPVPVLKPNEAMFESAFAHGDKVGMVYTFAPAVAGMEQELLEEADRRGRNISLRSIEAVGAREALVAGDVSAHNRIIAQAVDSLQGEDVILLAHFSMARALGEAVARSKVPVLSSPQEAVRKLKALLGSGSDHERVARC